MYSESHCDPASALYTILLRSTFSRSPSSIEGNSRAIDRALAGSTALSVVVFLIDLVIYLVAGFLASSYCVARVEPESLQY